MDYSPPGSSVHRILQARILEWVAVSYSRGSSQPKDQTRVSCIVSRLYYLSHQKVQVPTPKCPKQEDVVYLSGCAPR